MVYPPHPHRAVTMSTTQESKNNMANNGGVLMSAAVAVCKLLKSLFLIVRWHLCVSSIAVGLYLILRPQNEGKSTGSEKHSVATLLGHERWSVALERTLA